MVSNWVSLCANSCDTRTLLYGSLWLVCITNVQVLNNMLQVYCESRLCISVVTIIGPVGGLLMLPISTFWRLIATWAGLLEFASSSVNIYSVTEPVGISDVRILEFSVRISPSMLTKDPRPQKYCNLRSAVSPQSSLCSATHCWLKKIHFLFVNNLIKINRWYKYWLLIDQRINGM